MASRTAATLLALLHCATCFASKPSKAAKTPTPRYTVVSIGLHSAVNTESATAIIAGIEDANEPLFGTKADSILLVLDSPGGSVPDGLRISRAIEESKVPVVCVVDVEAASMAAYILESCQVRLITKRSSIMIHEPAMGGEISGQQTVWKNVAEWLRAMTKGMAEHLAHRLNVPASDIIERIRGGAMWFLDWEDAVKFAAVDGVADSVAAVRTSLETTNHVPALPMYLSSPSAPACRK